MAGRRERRVNLRWEWWLMRGVTSRGREGMVWSGWLWIITIVIFENNNRAVMCRWIQRGIRRGAGKRRWRWLHRTPKYDCWFSHRSIDENVEKENKNNDMTIRDNARKKYTFANRFFVFQEESCFASQISIISSLFLSLSLSSLSRSPSSVINNNQWVRVSK